MRRRLWLSDFTKQLALVLLAGLVTIIGLQRGLAPVLRLRDAVRERGRQRLDPLDPHMVQNELRPLVHALNDHMERVQNQMAAQRRFVSNAAHQLRTPLALISTQASVAARETDSARRDEALQALRSSTRQVTRLASQLLTLARAEPGSRRPRDDTIDLADTARRVLENLAEEALRHNIDLGLEAGEMPVRIEGDGTMLREMLVNLVDNALRYTQPGGRVTVGIGREGDTALLWVEDNGPGIPEAERAQVFERFYRIMGTEPEGSGLGLAIVREVVDGADGSVALGEAAGGGLLVRVRLPAV
jgi:two-component system sensor histidine kinase TctE